MLGGKAICCLAGTVGRMLVEAPYVPEHRYQRGVSFPTLVRDMVLPHIERWLQVGNSAVV